MPTPKPLLLFTSLFCALGSCGGGEREPGPDNLILISVDTLRADHMGIYGYERPTSPVMDAYAEGGTVFEHTTSTASWTVPSHMSMFTGQYTRTHGIDGWRKGLSQKTQTLASALEAEGFATAAFVNVTLLNPQRSFDRGFQDFMYEPPAKSANGSTQKILEGAIPWMKEHANERFFLFLHFYDVHSDYNPLPEFRKQFVRMYSGDVNGETAQLRAYRKGDRTLPWDAPDARHLVDLYDAGIRQFDTQVAELFEHLETTGLGEKTLVILTSDHGEEFLEHGGVLHGRTLHQELVHIPLIMRGPGVPAGNRVGGNASLVDIMPTALSLLGFDVPEQCEGLDLSQSWRSGASFDERLVYSEADKWLAQEPGNKRRAVRRGDFKLLYDHATGKRSVFDLSQDPNEMGDLSAEKEALVKVLWGELERFMAGKTELDETVEMSDEEMKELEDLGYF